jgi:hypothetical protein
MSLATVSTPPPDLTSVRLKLDRANQHLDRLRRETQAFLERDPAPLDIRAEKTTGPGKAEEHVVYAVVRELPPSDLGLTAGDAIQNIRHALDYLIYELSLPKFRNKGKLQFPIYRDECDFKVLAPPQIRGITGDERTLIERVQPYQTADPTRHPLAVLNRLANKDKHRVLLAIAAATNETDTWIASTNAKIAIHYFVGGPVEHDTKILAFTATPEDPTQDMYVEPQSGLEIQLKEADIQPGGGPSLEICELIDYLRFYVENSVIDRWFKWGEMPPPGTL